MGPMLSCAQSILCSIRNPLERVWERGRGSILIHARGPAAILIHTCEPRARLPECEGAT